MAKKIGAISYGSPFNGFLGDQKVLLSARIAKVKEQAHTMAVIVRNGCDRSGNSNCRIFNWKSVQTSNGFRRITLFGVSDHKLIMPLF